MLAIVFGTEKFEQYVYGRRVKVETDHKPIESIMKKNLLSAPKRLQRMMLRLEKYHLEVTYKRGSQMHLADTLSRAYLEGGCSPQKFDEEVLSTGSSIGENLESIDMICNLAISEESLTMIKQAIEVDNDLEKLKTVIRQGWLETKDQVPPSLAEYFNFRDELSIQNGLIFKGERLVIPYGVRSHMKARIHASHIGRDPYLSLLDWRNTPSEGVGYSPAQRLLCRRTRTLIPTAKNLLKPTIPKGVDRKLLEQKSKQAHYYNKDTKELPELKEGHLVRIKPLKLAEKRKPWLQAKVEGKVDV